MFATSILNLPCLKASSVPTFFHPVCKQTLYPSSISVLKILSASALKWHTMITCPVGLSLEPTISSTSTRSWSIFGKESNQVILFGGGSSISVSGICSDETNPEAICCNLIYTVIFDLASTFSSLYLDI